MSESVLHQVSPKKLSVSTWLFNPAHYLAGGPALGAGVAAIVVAGFVASVTHSHFDGVFDFHSGLYVPFWVPVAEGFINWLCMGVLLYAAGKLASKTRFRIIDVFGTQAFARWPSALAALAVFIPGFREQMLRFATLNFQLDPANAPGFIVACIVMSVAMIWMVALMYRAYAVSCNVSGIRGAVSFIPALLIAEVLSKVALVFLFSLI